MSTTVLEQPAIETPPDYLYEMLDGRYVEKDVSILAAWIASQFQMALGTILQERGSGWLVTEAICILDRQKRLRLRPDLAFVSAARWPMDRMFPARGEWDVVPDLAVEVVSPSNTVEELAWKRGEYFQHGVREVWIVIPSARVVEVWSSTGCRLVRHDQLLTSELFPGIPVDLSKILREIDAVESTEDGVARN